MGEIASICTGDRDSAFIYALASSIKVKLGGGAKVLVISAKYGEDFLYQILGITNRIVNLEDLVNFKLMPLKRINMLTALERINGIYFTGAKNSYGQHVQDNVGYYGEILDEVKRGFDICITELPYDTEDVFADMLIKKSAVVINTEELELPQCKRLNRCIKKTGF